MSHFKGQGRIKKVSLESERKVGLCFPPWRNHDLQLLRKLSSKFTIFCVPCESPEASNLRACHWIKAFVKVLLMEICAPTALAYYISVATAQLMPAQYFRWQSIKAFENVQSLGHERQSVLPPDTRSRLALLREVTGCIWDNSLAGEGFLCLLLQLFTTYPSWRGVFMFFTWRLKNTWKRNLRFSF